MIKLHRARSHLYRRQIVQEDIRWNALDDIYKIYMFLHRSDLTFSEHFRQTFFPFSVFPFRPGILGLFGALLQPPKKSLTKIF